jgi:hypothetical protein
VKVRRLLRASDQTEPKRTRFFWPVLLGPKEPGSFGENPKEPGSFYGVLFVGSFGKTTGRETGALLRSQKNQNPRRGQGIFWGGGLGKEPVHLI